MRAWGLASGGTGRFNSVHAARAHRVKLERRLLEACVKEAGRVDPKGHGIITATVGDIDTETGTLELALVRRFLHTSRQ
jgi:hypothetical protein